MSRRDDLLDKLARTAREIEEDVVRLKTAPSAGRSDRPIIEQLRVTAADLANSSAELARLEAGTTPVDEPDDVLLERIQSRFDHLPRKSSVVDELIAERRIEFWRGELESDDR